MPSVSVQPLLLSDLDTLGVRVARLNTTSAATQHWNTSHQPSVSQFGLFFLCDKFTFSQLSFASSCSDFAMAAIAALSTLTPDKSACQAAVVPTGSEVAHCLASVLNMVFDVSYASLWMFEINLTVTP